MQARLLFTDQYGDLQAETIPESGVPIYGHLNGEHPLQPADVSEPTARCRIFFDGESWRLQNIGAAGLTRLAGEVVSDVLLPERAVIECGGQTLKFESGVRRARTASRLTPPSVPPAPPTERELTPVAAQRPAEAQRIEELERANTLLQAHNQTLIAERDRMRQELEELAAELALLKRQGSGSPDGPRA